VALELRREGWIGARALVGGVNALKDAGLTTPFR
jgi:hypothetical protein